MYRINNFLKFLYGNGSKDTLIARFRNNKGYFTKWESELRNKRIRFERCIIEHLSNNNDNFERLLPKNLEKLYLSINRYESYLPLENLSETLKGTNDIELRYDITRYREIKKAISYVEECLEKLHNNPTANTQTTATTNTTATTDVCVVEDKPLHYEGGYTDENLNYIYEYLTKGRYIDRNTKLEDLIYYFSGRGNPPQEKIKWTASTALLCAFINELFPNLDRKWKTTSYIFDRKCSGSNYNNAGKDALTKFNGLYNEIKKADK